jgi:hypothetical protein
MTRTHLKRTDSDRLALCGIRPGESFKLIYTVTKSTNLETDLVCKVCLKAANGIKEEAVQQLAEANT